MPSEPTHCVVRCASSMHALPVRFVREILFRPPTIAVPRCDSVLVGLCHVRSEFLPVLGLEMFTDRLVVPSSDEQIIVVAGTEASWALLVDQVVALVSLEVSRTAETADDQPWWGAVVGWATYEDHLVHVLDPDAFYRIAERHLRATWADAYEPVKLLSNEDEPRVGNHA